MEQKNGGRARHPLTLLSEKSRRKLATKVEKVWAEWIVHPLVVNS
jgi:hypothetical protein